MKRFVRGLRLFFTLVVVYHPLTTRLRFGLDLPFSSWTFALIRECLFGLFVLFVVITYHHHWKNSRIQRKIPLIGILILSLYAVIM
jgi:hypothetical protein